MIEKVGPTIHKPGAYKSPGIYNGAASVYNGRGVYNDGAKSVNPEKSFVLNIDQLDLVTMKQGDLQFYGTGNKSKVDGKLRLSGANAFTRPLEDSLDYYFEIEFSITNLKNFLYPGSGRTFIQAGRWYPPFGVCFVSPYENLSLKEGLIYATSWDGWGYTFVRYQSTNALSIENVKFSERCLGNHYIQSINNEKILEFDTLVDYPSLTGDANFNTSTGNGLNKMGAVIEYGEMDIISMKFERYD